jgi:hypothetical protein
MSIDKFLEHALEHYERKLSEEKERFGVMGIADAWVENNSRKVVCNDEDGGAGDIWTELSKQSGLHLHVDYAPGDPQCVFAVLSKEPVPRPGQLYELWLIVESLKTDDEGENIERLQWYDGPYKIEVPESIFGD